MKIVGFPIAALALFALGCNSCSPPETKKAKNEEEGDRRPSPGATEKVKTAITGTRFDLDRIAVAGAVTIVDFMADW